MSATIRTEKFRIAPATYLRVVAGSSLPSLLASIVLLALISIAAGVLFDIRIILVALIFIFLVFPFYIYYIYFTRLLTVEAQNSVRPKDVTILCDPKVWRYTPLVPMPGKQRQADLCKFKVM